MRYSAARHRGVAWLAMLALWLTMLAPVISQALNAARADSTHCDGAMTAAGMAAMAFMPMPMPMPDPHEGSPHGDAMDACGYCGLLGHSPLLLSIVFVAMLLPAVAPLKPKLNARASRFTVPRWGHAPRGPPRIPLA